MNNESYSPLMPEQEPKGKSAIIVVIIIIVLLIIGGIYAINSSQPDQEDMTPMAGDDQQDEALSDSTDLYDIDKDLDNLEAGTIDDSFDQLDQETNNL